MVHYKTAIVDGLSVFYREAGTPGSPKLVLLHGFPASSHQYRNLIPALADRFHIIAPDYPGFGNSEMLDPARFSCTFDKIRRSSRASSIRRVSIVLGYSSRITAGLLASGS